MSELPVLEPEEQRILGSLLEKQTTVPASYPLSGNALRSACNQTSNRDPVVDLDQQTVERVARALKERGLLRIVWSDSGRRTLKYHQILDERLGLAPDERALLTVLLLRGAQAPGSCAPAPNGCTPSTIEARSRRVFAGWPRVLSRWCASSNADPGNRIVAGSTCSDRSHRRSPRQSRLPSTGMR